MEELLRQLAATRRDVLRVLSRLPPEALLSSAHSTAFPSKAAARAGDRRPYRPPEASKDVVQILHDLFSSVFVALSLNGGGGRNGQQWAFGGARRPSRAPGAIGGAAARPAAVMGWKHGDQVYDLDGTHCDLLVQAVFISYEADEASELRGSISALRSGGSAAVACAEEAEVPLTVLLDEAPSDQAAVELWTTLSLTWPGRFDSADLQERTFRLRRVTAAARALRRTPREAA